MRTQGQGMRDAELLVWLGDFNYRIDTTYEIAKENIRRNTPTSLAELLKHVRPPTMHAPALLLRPRSGLVVSTQDLKAGF